MGFLFIGIGMILAALAMVYTIVLEIWCIGMGFLFKGTILAALAMVNSGALEI